MDMVNFLGLSLLPILSPGPSTILVVRNSLRYSWMFALRRLLADLGGTLITATLLLYGLGAVIAASNLLVVGIQLAGACYVLIIGIRILRHAYWPSPLFPRFLARGFFCRIAQSQDLGIFLPSVSLATRGKQVPFDDRITIFTKL